MIEIGVTIKTRKYFIHLMDQRKGYCF